MQGKLIVAGVAVFVGVSITLVSSAGAAPPRPGHMISPLVPGPVGFEDCLAMATRTIQGEVAIAEFKSEDGVPIYEFEIIAPDKSTWNLECDARTGHIGDIERHTTPDSPIFVDEADIDLEQAEKIALSRIPGTIEAREWLIDSDGPVYEFDIQADIGGEFKVEVNAVTGAVDSISAEYWEIGEVE